MPECSFGQPAGWDSTIFFGDSKDLRIMNGSRGGLVGLRFQGVPIRWLEFHFQTPRAFSNPRYIIRSLPRVVAKRRDIESLHLRGGPWRFGGRDDWPVWISMDFFLSYKEFPSGIFSDSWESLFVNSKTFGNTEVVVEVKRKTNEHQWTT